MENKKEVNGSLNKTISFRNDDRFITLILKLQMKERTQ